jgi:hypothetical protein
VSFTLAALIAGWSRNHRLRNYQMVGLHLAGLSILLARTLQHSFFSAAGFFSGVWPGALAAKMGHLSGFLTVLLVACCTCAFWTAGAKLGQKKLDYMAVCNRFDAGLTSLFALLLIQLVLVTRGGLSIAAPPDMFFLYSFFLCGLSSIGLARHHGRTDKEFLPGIRGIVGILAIAAVMLTAAGLTATLAPPLLTPIAENGYGVVKTAARPLGALIVRFLIFIYRRDFDAGADIGGPTVGSAGLHPEETGSWGIWLAQLMAEGMIGLLFLGLLAVSGVALWRIIRWLLQRNPAPVGSTRPCNLLVGFFLRLSAWLRFRWRAVLMRFIGSVHIGQLFVALQAWGRFGGVSRHRWETPEEYACRLCARFPQTTEDIHIIVAAYQRHFYGETALDQQSIAASCAAWRRLRSPRHWSARWRSLFDRPRVPW